MTPIAPKPLGPEIIDIGQAVIIGRSATSVPGTAPFVNLWHRSISREHAKIIRGDAYFFITDLGSTAGTRVNGKPVVKEQLLKVGDKVEFGPVVYLFDGSVLRLEWAPVGMRLTARNVALAQGGRTLLSNVNFEIGPNRFVGILGPSGSGKSTLIKCLVGLITPVSGQLMFDEQDLLANVESYRKHMGYQGFHPQLISRARHARALQPFQNHACLFRTSAGTPPPPRHAPPDRGGRRPVRCGCRCRYPRRTH